MKIPKILDHDYHAFLALCFAAKAPVLLRSAPGTGKSKGAEAYATLLATTTHANDGGYGYFEIDMSKANIADFQGYLIPEKQTIIDHEGNPVEIMVGTYTYPYWAYDKFSGRPMHEFKHGMVVFEEWGQGDPEVKRAATSMIHERRLGRWLFAGMDILMLSNRDIDRSGVTKEYDFTINRIVIAELVPTLANLLVVGGEQGRSPITLAYAARNPDVFDGEIPKDQGPWLTPRSLFKMDDILRAAERSGLPLDSDLLMTAAIGTIGMGAASSYMAFIKARAEIPTVREVVASPSTCRIPDALDQMTFLVYDLASKTTRDNIGAIATYIRRLKADMGPAYFNAITHRDKSLVYTAEYSAFVCDNATLMSAVALRTSRIAS